MTEMTMGNNDSSDKGQVTYRITVLSIFSYSVLDARNEKSMLGICEQIAKLAVISSKACAIQ